MFRVTIQQNPSLESRTQTRALGAQEIQAKPDARLDPLLARLSPDTDWGQRQSAARKLGYIGNPAALSGLLTALPADPLWMVRCAMIQAVEKIGDPRAIPTLQRVEEEDTFLTVRCQASKAIETLSRDGN